MVCVGSLLEINLEQLKRGQMKPKERNIFLDLLKILAIFMVIVNHSIVPEGGGSAGKYRSAYVFGNHRLQLYKQL